MNDTVIISGSSITDDQSWPTWATWVKKVYGLKNVVDCSERGVGNEVILLKAVQQAQRTTGDRILIVQLTSVDKWDWYVEDRNLFSKIHQQKHPGIKVTPNDSTGYWCTGSHFPEWKEYYYQNYFSITHQMFLTLQMIQWFRMVCDSNGWKYLMLFESPILSVTEKQLNTGTLTKTQCYQTSLVDNSLCQTIFQLTNLDNLFLPGLLGYACINDLPWYHSKFKSHPGSLIHYYFTRDVLLPVLDQLLKPKENIHHFEKEAEKFQNLWVEIS